MKQNRNNLQSIKKHRIRKSVSSRRYRSKRSSLIGGAKEIYVLYLVSGSGPANERTGIKNRVLDICGLSNNKNSMLRAATDVPAEIYVKKLENIDKSDPALHNLYIDTITLGKDSTQKHKFEKVDVNLVKSKMISEEIPYVDIASVKYHITINPTFGLIETVNADTKSCPVKDGEKVKYSYSMDGQHCIWSEGLTYMFEYDYSVSNRSKTQIDNIQNFNYLYGTEFQ